MSYIDRLNLALRLRNASLLRSQMANKADLWTFAAIVAAALLAAFLLDYSYRLGESHACHIPAGEILVSTSTHPDGSTYCYTARAELVGFRAISKRPL